jgi:hypothetical protein
MWQGDRFFSVCFDFPLYYDSTDVPYTSLYYFYQKDKREKPGNLTKRYSFGGKQFFSLRIVNSFKNVMPLKEQNKSVDKIACTFVSRYTNLEQLGASLNIPSTEQNIFRRKLSHVLYDHSLLRLL